MPTSVLEAMAFGMPVVTRPVGGLCDFFENGKMGFLCSGKEPQEIASALESIISNKRKLLEMVQYNNLYAKTHFIAPIVAQNIANFYHQTPNYMTV